MAPRGRLDAISVEELNEKIPAYEFLELIGRGGMGLVYRARQRSLNRLVAVKLLPVDLQLRRTFLERFAREARALALLSHPNIVSVYDSGEAPAVGCYYVMEYVKGKTLRQLLSEGGMSSRKLLGIAMRVCEALQYAHIHGVVHRDVKPANILIDENGQVKVADFGLAKVLGISTDEPLTSTSDALGTGDYMAPESRKANGDVDHRADIYSLGVMLYEMLTGHVPKGHHWNPPSQVAGADSRFDVVVSRALQTEPQKRYQSVTDMSTEMCELVQPSSNGSGSLDQVPPPPPAYVDPNAPTVSLPVMQPRRPLSKAIVGVLGVSLVLAASYALLRGHPELRQLVGLSVAKTPSAAPAPPLPATHEHQLQLVRLVFSYGGFLNVTTPTNSSPVLTDEPDLRSEEELPQAPFTVWRVGVAGQAAFDDEDFAGLVRACEVADSVMNLNLRDTSVTDAGLEHLPRLAGTLTSLNLRDTRALTEHSLPFIAACKELRGLFVSASLPTEGDAETELTLVRKLRELLPYCEIFVE
ncbi:MAG: serine/threonine-protein kinase [Roseimicrobium sp.]